jgi:hypothetical protein
LLVSPGPSPAGLDLLLWDTARGQRFVKLCCLRSSPAWSDQSHHASGGLSESGSAALNGWAFWGPCSGGLLAAAVGALGCSWNILLSEFKFNRSKGRCDRSAVPPPISTLAGAIEQAESNTRPELAFGDDLPNQASVLEENVFVPALNIPKDRREAMLEVYGWLERRVWFGYGFKRNWDTAASMHRRYIELCRPDSPP